MDLLLDLGNRFFSALENAIFGPRKLKIILYIGRRKTAYFPNVSSVKELIFVSISRPFFIVFHRLFKVQKGLYSRSKTGHFQGPNEGLFHDSQGLFWRSSKVYIMDLEGLYSGPPTPPPRSIIKDLQGL